MKRGIGTYQSKKVLNVSGLPNMIFTFLICVACWYIGYTNKLGFPVQRNSDTSLFWDYICTWLNDINFTFLVGFLLLLLGAALLQRFNFRFVIIRGKTTLPFLLFLLLNSINPDFYPVRPISLAIFPLFFALFELFSAYQNPAATGRMFNMMFYLVAGSLIWPYLLWFIPVIGIGMYQFRILNVRTFSATLLGFFTVCWFVLGWCIWKHDFSIFTNFFHCLTAIQLFFFSKSWLIGWLMPFCVFFMMIVLLIYIIVQESENTIRTRHFLSFLFLFSMVAFMLSLLYASNATDFVCVFYLPVSIMMSYFLSDKKKITPFLIYYLLIAILVILLIVRLWNI